MKLMVMMRMVLMKIINDADGNSKKDNYDKKERETVKNMYYTVNILYFCIHLSIE